MPSFLSCSNVYKALRVVSVKVGKNVAGFLHLTWYTKNPEYTPYHRPFLKQEAQDLSVQHAHNIEVNFHRKLPIVDAEVTYGSLCYRTWPWADKEEVKSLLMK